MPVSCSIRWLTILALSLAGLSSAMATSANPEKPSTEVPPATADSVAGTSGRATRVEPSPRAGRSSALRIVSAQAGRPVWVNGRYAGLAPAAIDSLLPGTNRVEIGEPANADGWIRPWSLSIELRPAAVDTIVVGPLQRLFLRSDPAEAEAMLGRYPLGRTPLCLLVPAKEKAPLALSLPGSPPRSILYDPQEKADSTLILTLAGRRTVPELFPPLRRAAWGERARAALPVAAVLSAVGGVWARQSADRAYSSYRRGLDPGTLSRDLDRSRRYDSISVACWIAAETCLAAAAWSWIKG